MDIQQRRIRAALSRRRFLLSAAGLALVGCGGGSDDNSPGERFDGTYRGRRDTASDSVAVSASVDREGRLTFWTLRVSDDVDLRLADFGQLFLQDEQFSIGAEGVETFATLDGQRVDGRTQSETDSSDGFNWTAFRANNPRFGSPPGHFVGAFEGTARIAGADASVILGVSPDGNATFLGYFPGLDPQNPYNFEGLSFDENGDGYDYFLDLFSDPDAGIPGDRLSLRRDNGRVVLLYTVNGELDEPGTTTYEIPLFDTFGRGSRGTGSGIKKARPAISSLQTKLTRRKR